MSEGLPNIKAMIEQVRREANGDAPTLLLAKKPIKAPPEGQPNRTQIVRKKAMLKYEADKLYQQLGTTAQAYNQTRATVQGLQRVVEQFRDRPVKTGKKLSKAEQEKAEKYKAERQEYEDILKQSFVLLGMLKNMGRRKVAETKDMEDEMTKVRSDLFRYKDPAPAKSYKTRNTEAEGEAEADKQKPKYEDVATYPMNRPPSVVISPKKLLLRAKKEIAAKQEPATVEPDGGLTTS
jgi:hypothetical protein